MTFEIGDRGQRYEVRCKNAKGKYQVIGWSETISEAESFVKGVNLHPSFHSPKVIDRQAKKEGTMNKEEIQGYE